MTALEVAVRGHVGAFALDVALTAGEAPLALVGPNGAGKTSTLLMILGALPPDGGHVALGGAALYDRARGVDVAVEDRRLGFVPQRYGLFPHMDARDNVAYGVRARSRTARRERALAVLAELDAAALATRRPPELSGGELQRVALARALACEPRALLLDEPLAALDVSVRADVRRFLAQRLRAWRIPTVVVTHDPDDVAALANDVVVLEAGAVVQTGTLAALAARPATDFVRRFTSGSS
ncbi:MAG TPA: ATP-binding cassette domain-containing protein [Polyangia bacterium]|nr:ATP-binding cassette domain-containing protein [Polyangia bacterium]